MKMKPEVIKRAVTGAVAALALLVSVGAFAQDTRSEISVQGTGFFTKDSGNNGIQNRATNTGGVLVGYRYNLNNWIATEANYGWARNSQRYLGSFGSGRVETNIHQVTGAAVVKLPAIARLRPYALAGGGVLIFDPTSNGSNLFGTSRETRGTFLYGGGADLSLTRHLALRGEYRGFIYQAPSFNLSSLNSHPWTHAAQPSAGIVLRF